MSPTRTNQPNRSPESPMGSTPSNLSQQLILGGVIQNRRMVINYYDWDLEVPLGENMWWNSRGGVAEIHFRSRLLWFMNLSNQVTAGVETKIRMEDFQAGGTCDAQLFEEAGTLLFSGQVPFSAYSGPKEAVLIEDSVTGVTTLEVKLKSHTASIEIGYQW